MSGWQFDALIGNFVPTGGSGGGGGTIGGTIALGQVAVGSGADTITGTPAGMVHLVIADSCQFGLVVSEHPDDPPGGLITALCGGLTVAESFDSIGLPEINIAGYGATPFVAWAFAQGTWASPTKSLAGDPIGDTAYYAYSGGTSWRVMGSTNVVTTLDGDAPGFLTGAYHRFNFDEIRFNGDVRIEDGKAIKTDTITTHTALIQAYDIDNAVYRTFGTLTNANTPSFALAAPAGGSLTGNFSTLQVGGTSVVLTSRSIATTSPLAGGGDLSADRTLTIADAAADGSTKGAATFTAADFNSSSGLISIDYTNGQAASGAAKGFLTAADWTTFNNKGSGSVTSIATTSPISGGTITTTGTLSLLVNVDFGWTVGQTITAPAGATALTLAGGTQTSSFPVISATQTWNASGTTFTALKLNVTSSASAAASLLLDLQVGSATQFFVTKGGQVETPYNTSTGLAYAIHASGQNLVGISRNTTVGGLSLHGGTTTPGDSNSTMVVQGATANTPLVAMDSATKFGWASSNVTQALDAILTRDAAQTVVQRNGTTAQKFKVYNTFTTVDTAGEWFAIDWITTANVCNLQAVKGSSSGTARVLTLSYGGAQAAPVAAITIPITSGAITFGGGILLPAGAAGAGLAPLKFTSGTNLTTAEAGAMEYNGTNLFFTRAGTTRENVLVAVDNAAAPTTTIGIGIVNFYGSSAANFLGDPNRWLSVNVLGTVYKIPLYT